MRAIGSGIAIVICLALLVLPGCKKAAAQARIRPDEARAAALASLPGTLQAIATQAGKKRVYYEVEVQPAAGGALREVWVDGITGAVLKELPDDDDDDDDDDDRRK
jgi:hypothetical protein